MPVNRWVYKIDVLQLHIGIFLSHKKKKEKRKKSVTLWDNMDGHGEHYAKWIKPVRERHIPWFPLYVETNEQNKLTK